MIKSLGMGVGADRRGYSDFTRGIKAGVTTVDLKYRNGDTMMDMFGLKGTPAPQYLDEAVQKVEQGVYFMYLSA